MTDIELLEQFVRGGSREALGEVVRRHVGWVNAIAQRRVGDFGLAEDVTQAVFLVLAQKPPRVRDERAFGSWLFTVTNNTCSRAIRDQMRRKQREKAFAMEHPEASNDSSEMSQREWTELSPHLDEAVRAMNREDREAILLRFYQQKSHADVAAALGVGEEAARKRVQRAMGRLRGILSQRGVQAPAVAVLMGGLEAYATPPVAASVVQSALAVTQGAAASATTAVSLAKGVIFMAAMSKAKTVGVGVILAVLLLAGTAVMINRPDTPPPSVAVAPTLAPTTAPDPDGWRERFDQVYRLNDDEVLKLIPPPYIPERAAFHRQADPLDAQAVPTPPSTLRLEWLNDRTLSFRGASWSPDGAPLQVSLAVRALLNLKSYEVEAPPEFMRFEMNGDWILRKDTTPEARLRALAGLVRQKGGPAVTFEQSLLPRTTIVVNGLFALQPTREEPPNQNSVVHFYRDNAELTRPGMEMTGTVKQILSELGGMINLPLLDQRVSSSETRIHYNFHDTHRIRYLPEGIDRLLATRKLLDNVERQTGLSFSISEHLLPVWVGSPQAGL